MYCPEHQGCYIAFWSKDKELKELRASLETINKTSCQLINDIERHYKEICKERGIDLTAALEPEQAPQQAAEENPPAGEVPQPSAEYREALLVLDDATYLHIQPSDTGWDYTLYDVATMKQLDGGQLDGTDMGRSTVALQATLFEDIYTQSAQRQKKKKAAAGQTIFHAQMNVSVAALSIRAAVSFCSSETFDDPNTV